MARTLNFGEIPRVATSGTNASVFYASHWLTNVGIGIAPLDEVENCVVTIVAGDPTLSDHDLQPTNDAKTTIVLWDFQTGLPGTGLDAAAASGVSWVIGHADGLPRSLPIDVPEKWCGLIGANLALAALLEQSLQGGASPSQSSGPRFDVSSADTLRSFADQNAGNHVEVDAGWSRNGSVAVEHGGIFPQGFFPCRDGYVGMVGRSRKDWQAIRDVIGRPAWTNEARFDDPFLLASDSTEVDVLLVEALAEFDRDELLARSVEAGATLAPVYEQDELSVRGIVRTDFFADDGCAGLPFEIIERSPARPS